MLLPVLRAATLALALTTPAWAEVPQVVTDIPVTASLVSAVMGDLGQPQSLAAAGQDAHDMQLRPSQAAVLHRADLLVWVGPQMTGWLERTAEEIGPERMLTLLEVEGTRLRELSDGHAHDDGHAHEGDHAGHDHGTVDPHAWLDPSNAQLWLHAIAGRLAAQDPQNADTYMANAEVAAEQVAQLAEDIAARLSPVKNSRFVVAHDAYGYFTAHFGLPDALAVSGGSAEAPGAGQLTGLRRQLSAGEAVCAFPEANHDAAPLRTAVEGTGLRIGEPLDPEGSALPPGPGLYNAVLDGLADALVDCLGS